MSYDKPGCFGNAITYSNRSLVCGECEESQSCALAARQRIEELRSMISVEPILRMSHKQPQKLEKHPEVYEDLPAAAQKIIATLPIEAQNLAAQLVRMKVNFRKQLLSGVNPIRHQKPLAVSVLFDLLLSGQVDRLTYLNSLKERLGYTDTVSATQASISIKALTGLGIVKVEDEKLVIRGL